MSKNKTSKPWGDEEKAAWRSRQVVQRSYRELVLDRIDALPDSLVVEQYGALSCDPRRYPLYLARSRDWVAERPLILVTGGVHGYETSGVLGALAILERVADGAAGDFDITGFNLVCAPCVSPWGFETINRWNPLALDPNRNFVNDSPAEECTALMGAIGALGVTPLAHIDLHETTDTDNTVFRPARAARDGIEQDVWNIPDGFYTVGDSRNPQPEFQRSIIDAVRGVTHIAAADADGRMIGKQVEQEGVINYDVTRLHLCAGFTGAAYCTTTEVYPDSPRTTPAECVAAQMAAVQGALEFLRHVATISP